MIIQTDKKAKPGRENMSRLKQKIKSSGMKQYEISSRTGINYKTVNRQCRDGIRTTRVARRYAKVLKCHPLDLLEY